jgi:uncharacterized oxidoreductase
MSSGTSLQPAAAEIAQAIVLVLETAGASPSNAAVVAEHLLEAERTGRQSHGVRLLGLYVDRLLDGQVDGRATPAIVSDDGALLQIDGCKAFGQVVGDFAAGSGVSRARMHGVSVVTVCNAGHLGRSARWPEYAARHGFASIHFVNGFVSAASVVPFGGTAPKLPSGPIALGAPSADGKHVVLDFSVAALSTNSVRLAAERHEMLPFRALMRPDGSTSEDPRDFLENAAALLPFGGFKGYGLAVFAGIFAGIVAAGECRDIGTNSMLSIFFDIKRLTDWDLYQRRLQAFAADLRETPTAPGAPPVAVPGDRGRLRAQGPDPQWSPAMRDSIWNAARKLDATRELVRLWPAVFK